jgi:transmembrane sensor
MNSSQTMVVSKTLQNEAYDWVIRLTSGDATTADAEALKHWCAKSSAHKRAFGEAKLLWNVAGPAAREAVDRQLVSASAKWPSRRQSPLKRRAVFGGVAVMASAAIYMVMRPPLNIWPSLTELAANYHTGTGDQRQLLLADDISVDMNTQTTISLRPDANADDRIELISGEASVAMSPRASRPFIVVAAGGQTIASNARFNVQRLDTSVCVTCLSGSVQVETAGQSVTVRPQQQVSYDRHGLQTPSIADLDVTTAWQRGLLIFRNKPLSEVVVEINRYRPGKIILLNDELGNRPVFATFRIDHIQSVVSEIQQTFNAKVTALPGGIVFLS